MQNCNHLKIWLVLKPENINRKTEIEKHSHNQLTENLTIDGFLLRKYCSMFVEQRND
jgi:hypothetical protein